MNNHKTENSTSEPISYRYLSENGSKSTKTTVDKYIIEIIFKKYGAVGGQALIVDYAKTIRETKKNKWAGYLRESLIIKIIKKEYIQNYDINPDYIRVLCSNCCGASVPVNIPNSIYYALTNFFKGISPNPFISEIYSVIDGSDAINKSSKLRKILLSRLI